MPLNYVIGDALKGPRDNPVIIAHVTNDSWGWGRGFVLAVSEVYPKAEFEYRARKPVLGRTDFVLVERWVMVANMCAQHGYAPPTPLDYRALEDCLGQVATEALAAIQHYGRPADIHMPRIGAGLGGGSWERIEQIINERLVSLDLDVTVFTLPEEAGEWTSSG